jgi:lysophospholipase L1-like esterase
MKKSPVTTIVLIIAVALGVTACQPVYTGPQGPRVAVVGDSITNSASDELDVALTSKRRHLNGIDSIDLADGRTQLIKPVTATDPAVLVIELGINSAREVWNSDDLKHLEAVLADIKTVPCVIWVTPTALESSYFDHLGEGMISARIAMFQASLKKRLPKHPNVHLADFGAIEVQHPEWFHADRLHLNADGQVAYANYIADQVATHC